MALGAADGMHLDVMHQIRPWNSVGGSRDHSWHVPAVPVGVDEDPKSVEWVREKLDGLRTRWCIEYIVLRWIRYAAEPLALRKATDEAGQ